MWSLFSRPRNRTGMPEYTAVRQVPSRGLPEAVRTEEAKPATRERINELVDRLLAPPNRPSDDAPLFVELLAGKGPVSVIMPDGSMSLLVFTSPFRAGDYARIRLSDGPTVTYLSSSPQNLLALMRDFATQAPTFVMDLCPRCGYGTRFVCGQMVSPDKVLKVWAIHVAGHLERYGLYVSYAVAAATSGRLVEARDVLLETAGHVTSDDPELHFLLGQVAVGLGDGGLFKEACAFLHYLNRDGLVPRLQAAKRAGMADFSWPVPGMRS